MPFPQSLSKITLACAMMLLGNSICLPTISEAALSSLIKGPFRSGLTTGVAVQAKRAVPPKHLLSPVATSDATAASSALKASAIQPGIRAATPRHSHVFFGASPMKGPSLVTRRNPHAHQSLSSRDIIKQFPSRESYGLPDEFWARLDKIFPENPTHDMKHVLFDVDGNYIEQESIGILRRLAAEEGLISPETLAQGKRNAKLYKEGKLTPEAATQFHAEVLTEISQNLEKQGRTLESYLDDFAKKHITVRPFMKATLEHQYARGYQVQFFSAGPSPLIEAIARHHFLPGVPVHSSTMVKTGDQYFCTRSCFGPDKQETVESVLGGKKAYWTSTDSVSDAKFSTMGFHGDAVVPDLNLAKLYRGLPGYGSTHVIRDARGNIAP